MSCKRGVTLIEMIVVLIIIAIAAVIVIPNFFQPNEQAKALTAKNNLMAIYSAQQNYNNNNGGNVNFCLDTAGTSSAACVIGADHTCADNLVQINCNLSLNIPDDGSYTYKCTGVTCTALRTTTAGLGLTITLNTPIASGTNPSCNLTASWCP